MIQTIQLQYAAAPQTTYPVYGGRVHYGGNNRFIGRVGSGYQRRENWWGGCGGRGSSGLDHYLWKHLMCTQQGTNCRTPAESHQNNATWCNKMLGSKRNCTWHAGSVPASNSNVTDNINYITSEILCTSTIDLPNHTNIIAKSDISASNNYWRTKYLPVLTDITDTSNGSTVQLPNNYTMSYTHTGHIPLS